MATFLYIAETVDGKIFKVGNSGDPYERIKSVATQDGSGPLELRMVREVPFRKVWFQRRLQEWDTIIRHEFRMFRYSGGRVPSNRQDWFHSNSQGMNVVELIDSYFGYLLRRLSVERQCISSTSGLRFTKLVALYKDFIDLLLREENVGAFLASESEPFLKAMKEEIVVAMFRNEQLNKRRAA